MKKILVLVATVFLCSTAVYGEKKHYGADYIFEVDGIAVFWAVLKGAEIESNIVYINVVPLHPEVVKYQSFSVEGANAFSGESTILQERQKLTKENLIIGNYGAFHNMSERSIHLYENNEPNSAPQLTIYYKGVPDAAPEFKEESQLETFFKYSIDKLLQAM